MKVINRLAFCLWVAFCGGVLIACSLSLAQIIPVLAASDDFVDSKGSSTFIDPLNNDAAFGLRALDPLSFQILNQPEHGNIAVSVKSSGVEVGYFRSEPGADPVQYQVCLIEGDCDTAIIWFLEGNVGPLVSSHPDRREPISLASASLSGNVFVFVPELFPQGAVGSVRFLINGEPFSLECEPPYDVAGGTRLLASPLDTSGFEDGLLPVITEIKFIRNGGIHLERIETLAKIANKPILAFSYSADRSSAGVVDGAFFGGNIFVFLGTLPLNPGIGPIPWKASDVTNVRFFIDGAPVWNERSAPYDLAGGSVSEANPFNASSLTTGHHEIRAVVSFENGRQIVLSDSFSTIR